MSDELPEKADETAEDWESDPMPEMIETEADHGADTIIDQTGFVIGRVGNGEHT